MERLRGLVILTVAIGFGLYLGWTGIQNLRHADASTGWPHVTGEVTLSRVSTRQVRTNSDRMQRRYRKMYNADIRYSYAVNGVSYTSESVSFGSQGASEPSRAEGIVARYPVGATVAVYYDPDDPTRAVLEPGRKTGSAIMPIVGFGFAGLFVLFFLFMRWLARKQREMQVANNAAPPAGAG